MEESYNLRFVQPELFCNMVQKQFSFWHNFVVPSPLKLATRDIWSIITRDNAKIFVLSNPNFGQEWYKILFMATRSSHLF